MVLFPASQHEQLRDGSITLAFRSWKRPTVRAGGTLITPVGQLAIDTVDVVDIDAVTGDEARRAGFGDVAELRQWLRADRRDPSDRRLYRIAFHLLGDDPRIALRQDVGDDAGRAGMIDRLARMDARSECGPWTTAVLRTIAERPGTRSADLAIDLGMEQGALKQRIRRLKTMGLTESLDVGYRLSPRGEALLGSLG